MESGAAVDATDTGMGCETVQEQYRKSGQIIGRIGEVGQ